MSCYTSMFIFFPSICQNECMHNYSSCGWYIYLNESSVLANFIYDWQSCEEVRVNTFNPTHSVYACPKSWACNPIDFIDSFQSCLFLCLLFCAKIRSLVFYFAVSKSVLVLLNVEGWPMTNSWFTSILFRK